MLDSKCANLRVLSMQCQVLEIHELKVVKGFLENILQAAEPCNIYVILVLSSQ